MSTTSTASSANVRLAYQDYSAQKYAEAAATLQRELATDPNHDEQWRILGFCQMYLRQFTESVASLRKAVEMDPTNVENQYGLGLVTAQSGDYDTSIQCFDEALRLSSTYSNATVGLVRSLLARGQKHLAQLENLEAEADFLRAIKLDHRMPEPVIELTRHYLATNQRPKAQRLIEGAIQYIPNDPNINNFAHDLGVRVSSAVARQAIANQSRQAVVDSQMTTCPACKQQIPNWASICPVCKSQIKAPRSSFAAIDRGPDYIWQDIVYNILAVLWILVGGFQIYSAVYATKSGTDSFGLYWGVLRALMGFGLLIQAELVQMIAKYMCYLSLLGATIFTVVGFGAGLWLIGFMNLVIACLAGLQIYLLNYMGD